MSGKNTIVRSIAPKTLLPSIRAMLASDTNGDLNQGDLVILDTTNHQVRESAAEADGAHMLGIMGFTVKGGKFPSTGSTDVDASRATDEMSGPIYGVTAKVVLKAGDSLNPGSSVFLNPGVQALSGLRNGVQAAGTKAIGAYSGPAITAVTGGSEIEVLIGAREYGDVLKF